MCSSTFSPHIGLPAPDNTHEVAQQIAPECRIVYVDNDPLVLTHARALLTRSTSGSCDYLQADLRDTDAILRAAARTLDLTQPVAMLLLAVLHLVPADDDHLGSSRPWPARWPRAASSRSRT